MRTYKDEVINWKGVKIIYMYKFSEGESKETFTESVREEYTNRDDSHSKHFLVAKLLYKSKCPPVCSYVNHV